MLSQVSATWFRVAEALRPPPQLPLSEWLEAHLRLPTGLCSDICRTGTVEATSRTGAQRPQIALNLSNL